MRTSRVLVAALPFAGIAVAAGETPPYVAQLALLLVVSAATSALNTRERPNDEIDARSRRVERGFGGGVELDISRKLGLEFKLSRSDLQFDGDAVFLGTSLSEVLNRVSTERQLTLRYDMSPLTSVSPGFASGRDPWILEHD